MKEGPGWFPNKKVDVAPEDHAWPVNWLVGSSPIDLLLSHDTYCRIVKEVWWFAFWYFSLTPCTFALLPNGKLRDISCRKRHWKSCATSRLLPMSTMETCWDAVWGHIEILFLTDSNNSATCVDSSNRWKSGTRSFSALAVWSTWESKTFCYGFLHSQTVQRFGKRNITKAYESYIACASWSCPCFSKE